MKKIMIMAAVTSLGFFTAGAQTKTSEVCSMSKNNKTACYHTKYAENFPVCRGGNGYYICGETPNRGNSTIKGNSGMSDFSMSYSQNMYEPISANNNMNNASASVTVAPQSQSYPTISMINESSYEGYYPKKHYIKVSYDNIADDNLAPYEGLPSPQYDGPQKNEERNINAYNPNARLAPLTGRAE